MKDPQFKDIKIISFDLDETLWHCDEVMTRAEEEMYKAIQLCYPEMKIQDTFQIKRKMSEYSKTRPDISYDYTLLREEAIKYYCEGTSYDPEQVAHDLVEVFLDHRCRTRLFDNIIPMLEYLNDCHYKVGIVSNGNGDLRHHPELQKYISFFVNPGICKYAKPHSEVFYYVMKKMGIDDPQECLHIGDSMESDVLGAKNAHWKSILLNENDYSEDPQYKGITIDKQYKSIYDFMDHVHEIL